LCLPENCIVVCETGALSIIEEGGEFSRDVGPLIDGNVGAGFNPPLLKMC